MNLPIQWKNTFLKELTDGCQYGLSVSAVEDDTGFRLIRITDITDDGKLIYEDPKYAKIPQHEARAYLLRVGDILIARSGASVGKSILWDYKNRNAVFASYLLRIFPKKNLINPNYLGRLCQSKYFKTYVDAVSTSATIPNINSNHLLRFKIPLPPLLEQEQIVSILEQVEKIREVQSQALGKIDEILEDYFQEICYQNKAHLKTLAALNLTITAGSTPPDNELRSTPENSVPLIKVNNINSDGRLLFSEEKNFVSKRYSNTTLKRSIGLPNDVIINIVGPPMGKVGFLTNEYPEYNMNQAVALIRSSLNIEPLFLFFALKSQNTLKQIMAFSTTSRQVNLSQKKLKEIQIPIIEIKKQKEFVRIVDYLFAIREKILIQRKISDQTLLGVTQSTFAGLLTEKWREQDSNRMILEQQARERDELLSGKTAEIPEDNDSESLPSDDLSNTNLRAGFASQAFEQLRNNQKIRLQPPEDIKPAQYIDTFLRIVDLELQPHTEKAMLETPSQLMGFLQESEDPTLHGIADTLSSIDLTTRAEFSPGNPRHPRAYFWQEVEKKEESPLWIVYNAMRITQGYSNLQIITQTLDDLNEPLEEHRIDQAIDTLESAGLIEAVVLEMPNLSNLSEILLISAYRLPDLETPKFALPSENL
jgi:type I restriction enzyme, S subunit